MREDGVEKLLRDAKLTQIHEATNQINRFEIMKGILEERGPSPSPRPRAGRARDAPQQARRPRANRDRDGGLTSPFLPPSCLPLPFWRYRSLSSITPSLMNA